MNNINININKFIPDYSKFRIFQIGFHKCGTTTLFKLFQKNGIPSVHYDSGFLADSIHNNHKKNKPLLDFNYRKKVFFSDMENIYNKDCILYIPQKYFKDLDREYPNSKFILNIRDKDNWIKSRCKHDNGFYLKSISVILNKSESEVVEMWKSEWDTHNLNVINYFKDRPNDLLIFNIEKDRPQKIYKFFKPYITLNMRHYSHYNKNEKI
jgi:hypothetical protein